MSVRTRIIGGSLVALCLGVAGYSGRVVAQKPKTPHVSQQPVASSAAPKKISKTIKATPAGSRLNLNTATAAQLDALPGIGPKTAERIIEYRQKIGAFKKIEQIMNVRGVGEKNFLKLKDLITVGPGTAAGGAHHP